MKRVNYLSYSMLPVGMYQSYERDRLTQELVLTSSTASHNDISEMELNLTRITAIAEDGTEHHIQEVSGPYSLKISGLFTGKFLSSKLLSMLEPGSYSSLRLYLESSGGTWFHCDRSEKSIHDIPYLDFDFEGGMLIKESKPSEFILRFDFPPYRFSKAYHMMQQLLQRSLGLSTRLRSGLSNSVGHS